MDDFEGVTPDPPIEDEPSEAQGLPPEEESSPPEPAGARPRRLTRRFFATAALWLLLACGCATRFVGLDWDAGFHLHPDERFLTMIVPALGWPNSFSGYFDTAAAPLNPLNAPNINLYVYGQLPLFIAKATADALPSPSSTLANPHNRDNYDDLLGVGRFLSALFDCGSIALVLAIGWRMGGRYLGLLAAIFLAFLPLHIQHAHFFVVDTFATCFLLAAFLAILIAADRGALLAQRCWFAVAGLCWGAALACKISALLFAVVIAMCFIGARKMQPRPVKLLPGLFIVFIVAFVTFRVANPMAFAGDPSSYTLAGLFDLRLPFTRGDIESSPQLQTLERLHLVSATQGHSFWSGLNEQSAISSGQSDPPFNIQWVGRRDYIYPLRNLALWAVGLPIMLPALGGLFLAGYLGWKRRCPWPLQAAALWCLFIFFYYGHWFSKFSRYYLVITPFLALFAAWFVLALVRRARGAADWRRSACLGLAGLFMALAASWGGGWTTIYIRPNTRVAASAWVVANLPPGTKIANETAWDDGLPLGNPHGLDVTDLDLFSADMPEKRNDLLEKLDRVDWIFVTSNRAWGAIPRLPQRWPLTSAYYRALFDGKLQFAPVEEFASYPGFLLPGYFIPVADDSAEEAMTVYDHPRVVLFMKEPLWSVGSVAAALPAGLMQNVEQANLQELRAQGWRPDEASLPRLPHALMH